MANRIDLMGYNVKPGETVIMSEFGNWCRDHGHFLSVPECHARRVAKVVALLPRRQDLIGLVVKDSDETPRAPSIWHRRFWRPLTTSMPTASDQVEQRAWNWL